jgi:hypothetical protein
MKEFEGRLLALFLIKKGLTCKNFEDDLPEERCCYNYNWRKILSLHELVILLEKHEVNMAYKLTTII